MNKNMSLLLRSDSYAHSHPDANNPDAEYLYNYIESRGGLFDRTVFFGLQAYLKEYLSQPITKDDIDYADEFLTLHGLPNNRKAWELIVNEHAGYLPLEIKAVPEGLVIPAKNVLTTIKNTDPRLPW